MIAEPRTWRVQKVQDEVILVLCASQPLMGETLLSFPFSVEGALHVLLFLFDVQQEHGQGSVAFSIYEPWKEEPQ